MNKYERCLWLITTLSDYGDASFAELNERWRDYSLNYDGGDILERTFARDKKFIADAFQIDIEYDIRLRKYRLINPEEIHNNSLYKYLLGSFHINNLSSLALKHRGRVMLQDIPTGVEWLHTVLDAIDKRVVVRFNYTSYYAKDRLYTFAVIPCFVRLFEHRWYLICEYLDYSQTRVLALERMQNLSLGEEKATPSPEINPETFYTDCYGIIKDDTSPIEIRLKVYDKEVDYIRSVPIHHSQEETEAGDSFSIFRYFLHPSIDFIQQILWHRDCVEILSPTSFRQEIKTLIHDMLQRYGN